MIEINRDSSTPIYKQIVMNLKNKILNEEIPYGTCLPSERRLACSLGVNRNTVIKAYKLLADYGYISSDIPGRKGYFVVFRNLNSLDESKESRNAVFNYSNNITSLERTFQSIYSKSFSSDTISFAGNIIPDNLIYLDGIKKVINTVIEIYGVEAFSYCSYKGHPLLRKELAKSLRLEGMNITGSEILLLNETTQGLEYISHFLTKENDNIVCEYPIMPNLYAIFRLHGINIHFVNLQKDGPDIRQLEALFKKHKPKFFHTMPDYHGITGSTMSLEKRKKVLELSYKYNVPIIEERWFYGLNYTGSPLPSLYALDTRKNVIMLDDLIIRFYNGAKLSILAAPKEIIERAGRNISGIQNHLQSLEQLMLTEYLNAGYDQIQRETMVLYYHEKLKVMEEELAKLIPLGFEWDSPQGGLSIWCKLPKGINDMQLYKRLRKRNILIFPGKLFYPEGSDGNSHMRLSFSNVCTEDIKTGIKIIKEEIEQMLK